MVLHIVGVCAFKQLMFVVNLWLFDEAATLISIFTIIPQNDPTKCISIRFLLFCCVALFMPCFMAPVIPISNQFPSMAQNVIVNLHCIFSIQTAFEWNSTACKRTHVGFSHRHKIHFNGSEYFFLPDQTQRKLLHSILILWVRRILCDAFFVLVSRCCYCCCCCARVIWLMAIARSMFSDFIFEILCPLNELLSLPSFFFSVVDKRRLLFARRFYLFFFVYLDFMSECAGI